MNKVILIGRLTRDAEVKYANSGTAVARFNLAVARRFKKEGEQTCDFVNCVAFSKTAEFLEKYGHKGTKFIVEGSIQTGSYTNKEGQKVYTTDVLVQSVEFAESKSSAQKYQKAESQKAEFVAVDEIDDEELPFA